MSKNFHEQFDRPEIPLPSDRSTGLVFASVFAIVAFLWRSSDIVLYVALAFTLSFTAVSLVRPIIIRPLNIVWMKFALLLNKIVNPVVMMVLFAVVITPAGLLMQLRADPLRKRRQANTPSYWIDRDSKQTSSMINQF